MSAPFEPWNADLYQASHSYVWDYGRDLLSLLDIKPGEHILDVGCGTGQLTSEIARCGARVVGVDASPEMIAKARLNFPEVRFEVADVTALPYAEEYDAAFSNAALHWVKDQPAALASICKALKPAGRFAFEMGGHGNLSTILEAARQALRSFGVADTEIRPPWYFPTVGEYASLLEAAGFTVKFAAHFDRPTVLDHGEQGFAAWIRMFGGFALSAVPARERGELVQRWSDLGRPQLFRDGVWTADYKRLRMVATKS